ncbi:MAG: 3'(2'),5'-bisphosphate nucleotidase CysQ [Rhodobacteraceae bacterium]|nr:3'(2'),5'-bisphosphate nucleotidase CysQ [Paracoccaceae bacterium]
MQAHEDLDLLIAAAREAGGIARRFWRKDPEIWDKPEGAGPVTEADLAVNRMLHAELGRARPDYGWLSEETPDSTARLSAERTFIVDPIDGTRSFIEGDESFAHSLAIADNGHIIAAVVYLPVKDALYAATHGDPATLNGTAIRTSGAEDLTRANVLTTKASMSPEHWRGGVTPTFRRAFRASVAWRLCLVAEGRFDAVLSLRPTWEWDIAAGDLIARQAGATVSDRFGRPLSYNAATPQSSGLIAGPDAVWGGLRSHLLA